MTTHADIRSLVPQRAPILMVDKLLDAAGDTATTSLTVREDNYFLNDSDGRLEETGLMEHIAQSASAFAGFKATSLGAEQPPVGYIGEIKWFYCYLCPQVGDELRTTVTFGTALNGVTMLTAQTVVHDIVAAETQMKIYIHPDA